MAHPLGQRLLLERLGLDSHAAGMTLAIGRLVQQQRPGWIGAVHQSGERDPERLDVIRTGVGIRKVQPRRRRHAIVGMAAAALSRLEDWIDRARKRDLSRRTLLGGDAARCYERNRT